MGNNPEGEYRTVDEPVVVVHTCDVIILKAKGNRIKSSRPENLYSKIEKEKTQTKCDYEQENKNKSWGLGEYMSSRAKITDASKGLVSGSGTAAAIC